MKALLKLAGAGATVFTIALGMTVLQPTIDEPVKTAQADIAMFNFAPKSQQQRFVASLKRAGLEKPRAYDHNGNKLFFSTTTTTESPREVLERMQRTFVEEGVNDAVHLSPMTMFNTDALLDAVDRNDRVALHQQSRAVTETAAAVSDYIGGVVPIMVDPTRVVMVGASTNDGADTPEEWLQEVVKGYAAKPPQAKFNLAAEVNAMRYVEAFVEGRATRVVAVWSDENYDPRKIVDVGEDLNVDLEIPACPGCSRLYNIDGESEADYSTTAYTSPSNSVEQMVSFYDRSLAAKGWQLSPNADALEVFEQHGIKPHFDARMMQYSRGEEFITVIAWPDHYGATVQLARSN